MNEYIETIVGILGLFNITIPDGAIKKLEDISDSIDRKAYLEGMERQKQIDINNAINSYLHLKKNNTEIYDLLNKFFKIDSISDMEKMILNVKINNKCIECREITKKQGASSMENVSVRKAIMNNLDMLEWKPQRIIDYVKKSKM